MKLNKIASLALAGLMAVSMLAGCGDNSSSNGNGSVVVPSNSTSVVNAVNEGQSATNEVEVTFTSDAKLANALKDAIDLNRIHENAMEQLMGENFADGDFFGKNPVPAPADGASMTKIYVDGVAALSEEAAAKMVAEVLDEVIADLEKTTYEKGVTAAGSDYYDYTYEGSVVMASTENIAGITEYYYAATITQKVTEKTLEP